MGDGMDISKKGYWLILGLLLLSTLYVRVLQPAERNRSGELRLNHFPMNIDGWQGEEQSFPDWLPKALNAEEFFVRQYTSNDGKLLWFYVGRFSSRRGSQMHNPDNCYPAQGWKIVERNVVQFSYGRDGSLQAEVVKMIVQKGLDKRLVLFWYQIGEIMIASNFKHQFLLIGRAIIRGRMDGIIIRVSAPVKGDNFDDVLIYEKQFMEAIAPLIPEYLPK